MERLTDNRIAVVVAMDEELRHLIDLAEEVKPLEGMLRPDFQLTLGESSAIAVRCGIGLVNAAAATEWLIDKFGPDFILNFGCAGAHYADLMPGDVVIGDRYIQHSALHVLPDGSEKYKGFHTIVEGQPAHAPEILADPYLLAVAQHWAHQLPTEPWPQDLFWPEGMPYRDPIIVTGPVGSADIWTQSVARLTQLHERHQTRCEDMEAAAIAQVARLHSRPFLSVKDISNNEFHRPSDLVEYSDFPLEEVGKRAAAVVARVIQSVGGPGPNAAPTE
jgi:adenosylhomocysteine nucleosidase